MMPICGVNIHTSLNPQPPKLIFPQLFAPQSIVMQKDSHVGINPNVSQIIANSSSEFVAKYHVLLMSYVLYWKIVNRHLGKCADECDI